LFEGYKLVDLPLNMPWLHLSDVKKLQVGWPPTTLFQLFQDLPWAWTHWEGEGEDGGDGGEAGNQDEHAQEAHQGGEALCENCEDGCSSSTAGHNQAIILRTVRCSETLSCGRRQQDKVAAEGEEDRPDPDGEGGALAVLGEVEGGVEEGDGGGDDQHAHLVPRYVAEVSPEHSAETVEHSCKSTDHCQEVIIVDELLPKCFVHGVDVAHRLGVE